MKSVNFFRWLVSGERLMRIWLSTLSSCVFPSIPTQGSNKQWPFLPSAQSTQGLSQLNFQVVFFGGWGG